MKKTYGSISYAGMKTWHNEQGIETKYHFNLEAVRKNKPFIAEWIWLNKERFPDKQRSYVSAFCVDHEVEDLVACFRKVITISQQPRQINAYLSADSQYRFYIDECLSARGPARVGGDYGNTKAPTYWFYDTYDFTELLSVGTHCLSAEVFIKPLAQMDYSMGQGGFILELEITYEDGSVERMGTDSSWLGELEKGYKSYSYYDANDVEKDWKNTVFSDQYWSNVSSVSKSKEGIWNLIPRTIPPLCEVNIQPTEYISPFHQFNRRIHNLENFVVKHTEGVTIDSGEPIAFWLDFGKIHACTIHICIDGMKGTKLELYTEEVIGKNGFKETYI